MSVKLNGSSMHLVIVFCVKVNMLVRLLKLHSSGLTAAYILYWFTAFNCWSYPSIVVCYPSVGMMPSVKFSITVVWNLLNCCNIFSCLDIKHYYDLRRWKFLLSCATNCRYLSSVFCVQNFKYGYLGNFQNYYCDSLCITTNCSFASTVYSHFASVVGPTWMFVIVLTV